MNGLFNLNLSTWSALVGLLLTSIYFFIVIRKKRYDLLQSKELSKLVIIISGGAAIINGINLIIIALDEKSCLRLCKNDGVQNIFVIIAGGCLIWVSLERFINLIKDALTPPPPTN